MSRPAGEAALALIKQFEGCRLTAYKALPTEVYWTIGWGHYGPDVREGDTVTQAEADALLAADAQRYADYVDDPARCPRTAELNANQRAALISFTYNCGPGCLKTLCRGRSLAEIGEALMKYDRAGGKSLPGLARRRSAERALYEQAVKEEEEEMNIENMTDAQLIRLAERMNAALGTLSVSGALASELAAAEAAGITDARFPAAFCTRAQAAAMAVRSAAGAGDCP